MAKQQGSSAPPLIHRRFCRDFSFLFPGTKRRGQGLKETLEKFSNYGKLVHRLARNYFPKARLSITFDCYLQSVIYP
jgi:hypothetical protein